MTGSTPPVDSFSLQRTAVAVAIALPVGMAYFAQEGGSGSLWSWTGGVVWMLANLYCLERMIRALLAPPEAVDKKSGALYGALVLLVLPALLLGLLFWSRAVEGLTALTVGITLPLVLVALRAAGTWLQKESPRGREPSGGV